VLCLVLPWKEWLWSSRISVIGTNSLVIVSELRLGFGLSLSPNIAQRFSDAIIGVFMAKFDAEEEIIFNSLHDPHSGECTPYNPEDQLTIDAHVMSDVCN